MHQAGCRCMIGYHCMLCMLRGASYQMPHQRSVAEAMLLSHTVTLSSASFPSVSALFPKPSYTGDCRSLGQWVHTETVVISPHHIISVPLGTVRLSASSAEPCRAGITLSGPQESDGVGQLYSTPSAGGRENLPASQFRTEQLSELKPWPPEAAITHHWCQAGISLP